jgi:hypothetical protein
MSSPQINIPRPLTVAVYEFTPLVERFRDLESGKLVLRLGNDSNGWCAGIPESKFDEIYDTMSSYGEWNDVSEWEDVHEYKYTVGTDTVRTNVHISNSVSLTHTVNHRLDVINLKMLNHGLVRGYVKVDTPMLAENIPETITPSVVRIKKRKTFTKNAWKFVVSKIWKGTSRSSAENAQSMGDTVYDIEIEFKPDAAYWGVPRHTSTYVATSMLMKLVDILSSEMISIEPLPK